MPSVSTATMEVLHLPQSVEQRWLPEGPCARIDPRHQKIYFVNIQNGRDSKKGTINVFDCNVRSVRTYDLPGRPGFIRPTTQGNVLLVGLERQLVLYNLESGSFRPLAEILPDPHNRVIINDGTLTPDGTGVIFGTKDPNFSDPIGHLYLYRQGMLSVLAEGETCANGNVILETGQGLVLMHIDTKRKAVVTGPLDLDARTFRPARELIRFAEDDAFPDGMFGPVDIGGEQAILIAMFNPGDAPHGEVRQYSVATGELQHIWQLPGSPQVTCPTLAASGGRTWLIATTAAENMSPERLARCPSAGALFYSHAPFRANDLPKMPQFQIH